MNKIYYLSPVFIVALSIFFKEKERAKSKKDDITRGCDSNLFLDEGEDATGPPDSSQRVPAAGHPPRGL